MTVKPLVSICIFAYNHEKYLAEALDSVLQQKVNFGLEVIIGEDYSIDSTLQIAQAYQARHPKLIRIEHSGHREKLFINGHATGRYNFLNTLSSCRGKYIALLDGDDYWIDSGKLQKQVDFLEQYQDYSIVFHNVYMRNMLKDIEWEKELLHPSDFTEKIDLDELLLTRNFVPTSSVVFRNNIPNTFPDTFYKVAIGDWPLHLFNLNFGKVKYLGDVMGVYRTGNGAWSQTNWESQLLLVIHSYKSFTPIIPARLKSNFRYAASIRYKHLIRLYFQQRKLVNLVKVSVAFLRYLAAGTIK